MTPKPPVLYKISLEGINGALAKLHATFLKGAIPADTVARFTVLERTVSAPAPRTPDQSIHDTSLAPDVWAAIISQIQALQAQRPQSMDALVVGVGLVGVHLVTGG